MSMRARTSRNIDDVSHQQRSDASYGRRKVQSVEVDGPNSQEVGLCSHSALRLRTQPHFSAKAVWFELSARGRHASRRQYDLVNSLSPPSSNKSIHSRPTFRTMGSADWSCGGLIRSTNAKGRPFASFRISSQRFARYHAPPRCPIPQSPHTSANTVGKLGGADLEDQSIVEVRVRTSRQCVFSVWVKELSHLLVEPG